MGPTVLAAVRYVLHPASAHLAQLAPDPDGGVVAAADCDRVRLDVVLSFQGNDLFTAMQELNAAHSGSPSASSESWRRSTSPLVLLTFYIGQAQIIHWRLWLNQRMLGDWLRGAAYHRGRFVSAPVDNPDQRIQQDITSYTSDSQSLALGAVSSAVSLVSFTIILWQLSGPLTLRTRSPEGWSSSPTST